MEELRHFKIHHKTFKLGFENTTLLEIELEKFKPNYIFQIERNCIKIRATYNKNSYFEFQIPKVTS